MDDRDIPRPGMTAKEKRILQKRLSLRPKNNMIGALKEKLMGAMAHVKHAEVGWDAGTGWLVIRIGPVSDQCRMSDLRSPCHSVMSDAQSKCHTCHVRSAESCRMHRRVMSDCHNVISRMRSLDRIIHQN